MLIETVPLKEEYISSVAELERLCFSVPWSEDALAEELKNPQAHFLCAVENGCVLGYIGVQEIAGEAYITNVAVAPERRGRGIGTLLLEAAERGARARGCAFLTLEVRAGNCKAIKLYERNSFESQGVRPGFYTAPCEDAVIMTKFFEEGESK